MHVAHGSDLPSKQGRLPLEELKEAGGSTCLRNSNVSWRRQCCLVVKALSWAHCWVVFWFYHFPAGCPILAGPPLRQVLVLALPPLLYTEREKGTERLRDLPRGTQQRLGSARFRLGEVGVGVHVLNR